MGVFGKDHHLHVGLPGHHAHHDPAGWYPDPTGRFDERFWDGEQWTTDARDGTEHLYDLDEIDLRIVTLPPSAADGAVGTATERTPQPAPAPAINRFLFDEAKQANPAIQSTQ